MAKFINRLAKESSPYLLQHAHNPVDWYPWGEEALEKARKENKPLLISIGYAACHWCHVMEKESFEDEETAAIMNHHFVNIKIDREERPDLDHIYMDAVQVMAGSAGWPLNVFLTPESKPFYGGTYFPPRPAFNRPSWKEVLYGVVKAFNEKRNEIDAQAENLTGHLIMANDFGQQQITQESFQLQQVFNKSDIDIMFENILKAADKEKGGFGRAPKFPQSFIIQFLLHYYYYTGKKEALQQACLSLDKMIYGGIYDQAGGGFARYATDNKWLVPHFEKMLYDNALLIMVLSEAFQLTGKKLYGKAIRQTLSFIEREMLSPEGGFYSALDADSEGVEGRFYVWKKAEIEEILGDRATLFCEYYDITEEGNWENMNILNIKVSLEEFAATNRMNPEKLEKELDKGCLAVLNRRNKKIRPLLDDKMLLGWNALMITAYFKAFAALGDNHYKKIASQGLELIEKNFKGKEGSYYHTYKKNEAKHPAFLDDYAYLIQALIHAQEITADPRYLIQAKSIASYLIENFSEEKTGFFFFTHKEQKDVIFRKKEVYDGAVPSGNSVMAFNLYYLGIIFDYSDWRERALQLCALLHDTVNRYPTSFGIWATLMQGITYGIPEIAIVGENFKVLHNEFLRTFIPLKIFQASAKGINEFPLLAGKPDSSTPLLFLCKNYSCQTPVTDINELIRLIENVYNLNIF